MIPAVLAEILADHQAVGAIGRRATTTDMVEQSLGFLKALGDVPPGAFVVDVGSGGGLPALPIIALRPDLRLLLVERRGSRAGLLRGAIRRLDAEARATVVEADARGLELVSPDPCVVVARCAGDPLVVLDLAASLVTSGSELVISAPASAGAAPVHAAWREGLGVEVGRWHYLRLRRR